MAKPWPAGPIGACFLRVKVTSPDDGSAPAGIQDRGGECLINPMDGSRRGNWGDFPHCSEHVVRLSPNDQVPVIYYTGRCSIEARVRRRFPRAAFRQFSQTTWVDPTSSRDGPLPVRTRLNRATREHSGGIRLKPELARGQVFRISFDGDPLPTLLLAHLSGRIAPGKRVHHEVPGIGQKPDKKRWQLVRKRAGCGLIPSALHRSR